IGGISLLLALFAFQVLPINFAGLALILLGIAFMVAEAFVPSFGALGLGGIIAFVIGSLMLMDTNAPGYAISLGLIIAVTVTSAIFFILIIGMAVRARYRPVVSGSEELIGAIATVREDFETHGTVLIHSESWNAESAAPLKKGQEVRVLRRDGLTLFVEPVETPTKESES
ncbi:MAG TPA: NfeD family protein, partial [Mariprofundaceae bacterium]|nr:NfeD family protein [Mariprofundaceae bacterium]